MNEITVTVKIEPPDGSWTTANELIKTIVATNPVGDKLHIEVGNVFTENKRANMTPPINQSNFYEKNVVNFGNM